MARSSRAKSKGRMGFGLRNTVQLARKWFEFFEDPKRLRQPERDVSLIIAFRLRHCAHLRGAGDFPKWEWTSHNADRHSKYVDGVLEETREDQISLGAMVLSGENVEVGIDG